MQLLRLQMRVSPKHFPVLVPRDERNLFDCKACFKQAARSLVTQIVEMQVFNFQFLASPAKRRAH